MDRFSFSAAPQQKKKHRGLKLAFITGTLFTVGFAFASWLSTGLGQLEVQAGAALDPIVIESDVQGNSGELIPGASINVSSLLSNSNPTVVTVQDISVTDFVLENTGSTVGAGVASCPGWPGGVAQSKAYVQTLGVQVNDGPSALPSNPQLPADSIDEMRVFPGLISGAANLHECLQGARILTNVQVIAAP